MLFLQRRVSRCFCPQPLLAAPFDRPPATSVIAGGVGVPFPARLAVGFFLLLQMIGSTAKMWISRCPFAVSVTSK